MTRMLLIAALFLFSDQAEASKLWIREFTQLATQKQGDTPQAAQEPGVDQAPVDFSGGPASSAATQGQTRFVRLICDAACSYSITSAAGIATTTNALLPANVVEYVGLPGGTFINVRSNP